MPKQVPESIASMMNAAAETAQGAVKAVVPGTLVANILIGVGLKNLWKAINVLSFITYVEKWKVGPPANLAMFF